MANHHGEVLAVTELVALTGALGALNVGGALLARLHADEQTTDDRRTGKLSG